MAHGGKSTGAGRQAQDFTRDRQAAAARAEREEGDRRNKQRSLKESIDDARAAVARAQKKVDQADSEERQDAQKALVKAKITFDQQNKLNREQNARNLAAAALRDSKVTLEDFKKVGAPIGIVGGLIALGLHMAGIDPVGDSVRAREEGVELFDADDVGTLPADTRNSPLVDADDVGRLTDISDALKGLDTFITDSLILSPPVTSDNITIERLEEGSEPNFFNEIFGDIDVVEDDPFADITEAGDENIEPDNPLGPPPPVPPVPTIPDLPPQASTEARSNQLNVGPNLRRQRNRREQIRRLLTFRPIRTGTGLGLAQTTGIKTLLGE